MTLFTKSFSKTRLALIAAGLGSVLAASSASAEYRVTAFGDAIAYKALISMDVESAKSAFYTKDLTKLDFVAANNLCVTQILSKELSAAIASCELALEKVETDFELTVSLEKEAKASIFSNLAVAKAMSGDLTGASADLERALMLNVRDQNAKVNIRQISANLDVSGDIAQN
ncbi:MAG: hypothetical protein PsegKO_22170 [Pseudohongiellaceae bacterium]|jgi:hypothetical protein